MGVNSLPWYYAYPLGGTGEFATLSGDEWHHCYRVLRLSTGDTIILTDGKGRCMKGLIGIATAAEGQIQLMEDLSDEFRNPRQYKLSIGVAPTKNMDRIEFAVEKMVELGVDEICFLECRHGERSKVRMERMEKIVTGAAKQSRKIALPALLNLQSPEKYIQTRLATDPGIEILVCHQDDTSKPVHENYSAGKDVVILVGPEGGFSMEELNMMKALNVKMAHLGPFRLRVETAAVAACAGIHIINEMKYTS